MFAHLFMNTHHPSLFPLYIDTIGVIPHPTDGGWYYVSNSETKTGGVGTLRFNASGEVIGYERTLTGTIDNCGGGRTPWYVKPCAVC